MASSARLSGADGYGTPLDGDLDGSQNANVHLFLTADTRGLTLSPPVGRPQASRHEGARDSSAPRLHSESRRGGRVVECTGLENRRRGNSSAGSNPAPSAQLEPNRLQISLFGCGLRTSARSAQDSCKPHLGANFGPMSVPRVVLRADAEVGVEPTASLILGARKQVPVAVERDRDGGMAHGRRDGLRIEPGRNHVAGERVPGLMEPDGLKVGPSLVRSTHSRLRRKGRVGIAAKHKRQEGLSATAATR